MSQYGPRSGRKGGRYRRVAAGSRVDESLFGEVRTRALACTGAEPPHARAFTLLAPRVLWLRGNVPRWCPGRRRLWLLETAAPSHATVACATTVCSRHSHLPPQRRTARSRSGVSVVSRGDVLRASGSAVMESAAAPTFVTASELNRIKQSTAIRTAEDIKREKAEAAARMEKRQAVSKARKVCAAAWCTLPCAASRPLARCLRAPVPHRSLPRWCLDAPRRA